MLCEQNIKDNKDYYLNTKVLKYNDDGTTNIVSIGIKKSLFDKLVEVSKKL